MSEVKAYGQGPYDRERQCRTYCRVLVDDTHEPCSEDEFWSFVQSSINKHNAKPLEQRQREADELWEQSIERILQRGLNAAQLRALAGISDEYGDWMTRSLYIAAAERIEQTKHREGDK